MDLLQKRKDCSIDFRGKRVLVLGLGLHGGGVETVKFLAKRGARVTVTDLRSPHELRHSIQALRTIRGVTYILGRHRKKDIIDSDIIVKNPGVPPDSPYLQLAQKHHIAITSDIGIFFKLCPARIIGVTGTRGKSTTAYLIWKFLRTRFPRTFLAGNIRTSVLPLVGKLQKKDLVVIELSSFQLADLAGENRSPHIAVITNILRDHINWHQTFQKYIAAKRMIFMHQQKGDWLFINQSDARVRYMVSHAPVRAVGASLPKNLRTIVDKNFGRHYRPSVALAVTVARKFGISSKKILRIVSQYRGLEGREERIGTFHGISVINDTTATIPEATIAALKRFRPHAQKMILIAGGQNKNLFFDTFAITCKRLVDILILLPGTATNMMIRSLRGLKKNYVRAPSMEAAVLHAAHEALPGDIILLSPGAASFGLFQNEFDRGSQFVATIKRIFK